MAKKIQDGNQIVTNVDSNDNLTFSIKDSFIDSTPTTNSTNLVTSGGVKSALDINTTNIGPLSNLTTTNKTSLVNAVNEINAPGKWVSVGATAPTDGKRVWFRKSNNLFNNNAERKNAYIVNPGSTGQVVSYSYSSATYSFVNCCKVGQGKTYTIRWKQNQTPASTNGRQGCIVDNDNIVQQYMVTWHDGENYDTFTANANGFLILGTDIFATNIQIYESDIEEGIYVDEEEWYSKPKVLWESSTGVTSGSITLNESIENYSYIEVEYSINTYSSFRGVARLTKNSSTSTVGSLVAEFGNGTANGIICWTARIVIDNANATIERNYCLNFTSSGNTAMSDNYIRVLKILGYKE